MDSNKPHTIVIAVDGLRAAALGAYGATAHSTPGIDYLTSESVTYDWCYADSPDRLLTYEAIRKALNENKDSISNSLLVSDSTELLREEFAESFSTVKKIELEVSDLPAESIGDTQFAQSMAQFAEQLVSQFETRADSSDSLFAWLDLGGFYGQWDAPVELSESLLDDEDPRFEITPTPPHLLKSNADEQAWCDARFSAVCRYAAQTMVLDACIESLIELINGLFERETYRVVLLGVRGYPLGEHGQIGGVDTRLFSEQQQVPFLLRSQDPNRRYTRIATRTTLSAVLKNELSSHQSLEPSEESNSVLLSSSDGTLALQGEDWFLRKPSSASTDKSVLNPSDGVELYLKPDDRWEQNDIASLKPEVVKTMLARIECPLSPAESTADSTNNTSPETTPKTT